MHPNAQPLEEAQRQLSLMLQQQEELAPALYRDLALYLQVLREGLLPAVQQACFHLATQVVPERYAQLPQDRRLQFQQRLASLVQRCSALLTVEQLMGLASQQLQREHRRRSSQRQQLLQAFLDGRDPETDDPEASPSAAGRAPGRAPGPGSADTRSRAIAASQASSQGPQGSVTLGLDLPLSADLFDRGIPGLPLASQAGAAASLGSPPSAPGSGVSGDAEEHGALDQRAAAAGSDHPEHSVGSSDPAEPADAASADIPAGSAPGEEAWDHGWDAPGQDPGLDPEDDDSQARTQPDASPASASDSLSDSPSDPDSERAVDPAFADASWAAPDPASPQAGRHEAASRSDQSTELQFLQSLFQMAAEGLGQELESSQPSEVSAEGQALSGGMALSVAARIEPVPALDPAITGSALPRDPLRQVAWWRQFDRALSRRLRNLSHALNVEMMRLGLAQGLLPLNLLDAVLEGQVEALPAPANLLRLPLPLPSASGGNTPTEVLALLLRPSDLEYEQLRLRTCRKRLEQRRRALRTMAKRYRIWQRRVTALEAEQQWFRDSAQLQNRPLPPSPS